MVQFSSVAAGWRMSDNAPTPELVALLASDPVTMFAMAEAFRKAHDEHTGLKVAKIYAAGQRAEANVIVGLRAALEVLSTRAATVPGAGGGDGVSADLSMLVRRLALDIRALADEDVPAEKSRLERANKAIDYLRRKGLDGSPLRDDIQPATPASNLPGRLIELLNSMVEQDGLAVANDSLSTVSSLLEEVLAAIPSYRKVIDITTIAMIVRDVCETEPADPDRPDSVVITVQEMENILADRLGVILDE